MRHKASSDSPARLFCIIVAFGSEAVTKFPNADFVLAVLALATVNVGATVANAKTANRITASERKAT